MTSLNSDKLNVMAADDVYQHLKLQNRPFSINDIVSNFQKKFGKSAIQKAVDLLINDGKIFEKVYGKQKVYCIVQEERFNAEDLTRINRELQVHANQVESRLQDIQREITKQEVTLTALKSSITLEEAKAELMRLQQNIATLNRKLDDLMESVTCSEDATEFKRKVEADLNYHSQAYLRRKRICTEVLECILENYPGSKSELYQEIGIEVQIVERTN